MKSRVLAFALCFLALPALAQKTPAALKAEINTSIAANGAGAITGPVLNGVLNDMAISAGSILGPNTWHGANIFSGLVTLPSASVTASMLASGAVVTNLGFTPMSSVMGANTIKGNNTGSTGAALDLTAAQVAAMLPNANILSTHQFYTSGGANIQRFNDRVFVGAATLNGGNGFVTSGDWWCQLEAALGNTCSSIIYSQFTVEYDNTTPLNSLAVPGIAGSFAIQSLGMPTNATPIALNYAAYANSVASGVAIWGLYGETHYFSGTANYYGYENETRAEGVVATNWTPYFTPGPGLINEELGCGAGRVASHDCTVAMYISANPQQYGTGILFLSGSVGAHATGGSTIAAIEMPNNYQIQWYSAGTTVGASIYGSSGGNLTVATNGTGGHLMVNGGQVYCGLGATVPC